MYHRLALRALAGVIIAGSGCSLALDFEGYQVAADAGPEAGSAAFGPSVATFDAYHFARGRRSFAVAAPEGLLANDGAGARVRSSSRATSAGGSVQLATDGSFEYVPPGEPATFWGDDSFEYELLGEPRASARVRVTLQPPALTLAELFASGGAGFGIAGANILDLVGGRPGSFTHAGDVNGDGLEDFAIGVTGPTRPDVNLPVGRSAYVLFGKADARNVSLAEDSDERAPGFAILGDGDDAAETQFGMTIAAAGDVNGDGLADVIVSGSNVQNGLSFGAAYVVFGKTDAAAVSSREILAGNGGGFAVSATAGHALIGFDVDGAGDVNGDGLDDVIVGIPGLDAINGGDAGGAVVVYGKVGPELVDVNAIIAGGSQGFAILGDPTDLFLGLFVAGVGDVNGDGLSDVAASTGTSQDGRNRGRNVIVLGKRDSAVVRPADIESGAAAGFLLVGADDQDNAAIPAGVGDIDGDGIDDLAIAAPNASFGPPFTSAAAVLDAGDAGDAGAPAEPDTPERQRHGVVYVVFGSRQPQSLDLRVLESEGGPGFAISSTRSGALLGNSISSGDVDGDGRRDIVAAVFPEAGYGRAFVIFGKEDTKPVLVPPGRGDTAASVLTIICPPDELACNSIASGADANGDGLDDLLLGSVYYPLAPQAAGGAYLAFGWDMNRALQGRDAALIGRSGDDVLELGPTPIVIARGGGGTDTLRAGSDVRELDLTESGRYESIEIVDVRGNGPQRVRLDGAALRRLPQNHSGFAFGMARKLSVLGDAEDTLEFDLAGYTSRGADGGRAVYGREGVYYGLEISQGLRVEP